MSFIIGDEVTYKDLIGTVSFVSEESISIMISRGKDRLYDVNLVVYASDYDEVYYQDEK